MCSLKFVKKIPFHFNNIQSCFRRLIMYFDLWLHGVSSVKNLQANVKFLGWMLFGKLFGDGNNFDIYNVWREKFVCIR